MTHKFRIGQTVQLLQSNRRPGTSSSSAYKVIRQLPETRVPDQECRRIVRACGDGAAARQSVGRDVGALSLDPGLRPRASRLLAFARGAYGRRRARWPHRNSPTTHEIARRMAAAL
jgi:hypothetical protein